MNELKQNALEQVGMCCQTVCSVKPVAEYIEHLERSLDKAFLSGICVALQQIVTAGNSTLWREVVQSVGVEKIIHYAAIQEPDEWGLAGFEELAKFELGINRPTKGEA